MLNSVTSVILWCRRLLILLLRYSNFLVRDCNTSLFYSNLLSWMKGWVRFPENQ